MSEADAEDFASCVKVRLIDNDYAVLQKFAGHCTFKTFIAVVIHRILLDYRIHLWGKWHPSTDAKRLGAVAVQLEKTLYRDGQTLADALPLCRALDAAVTLADLETLAKQLPKRAPRARPVVLDDVSDELHVPPDSIYDASFDRDRATLSDGASDVVREAMNDFSESDQILLRLHFGAEMKIAEIARVMDVQQKPLYRRLQRCLREFRRRLEAVGITAASVEEILSRRDPGLDFGLETRKSSDVSVDCERPQRRGGGGSSE